MFYNSPYLFCNFNIYDYINDKKYQYIIMKYNRKLFTHTEMKKILVITFLSFKKVVHYNPRILLKYFQTLEVFAKGSRKKKLFS